MRIFLAASSRCHNAQFVEYLFGVRSLESGLQRSLHTVKKKVYNEILSHRLALRMQYQTRSAHLH